jgi:hypothetical protein
MLQMFQGRRPAAPQKTADGAPRAAQR